MLLVGNVDGPTNYPFSVEETMRLLRLMGNRYEQDLTDRELAITWIIDSINGKQVQCNEYEPGVEILQMQSRICSGADDLPFVDIADLSQDDIFISYFSSYLLFFIFNKLPVVLSDAEEFYIESSVANVLALLRSSLNLNRHSVQGCHELLLSFLAKRTATLSIKPYVALASVLSGLWIGHVPLAGTSGDEELAWLGDQISKVKSANGIQSIGGGLLDLSTYNMTTRGWRRSSNSICQQCVERSPGLAGFTANLIGLL